MDICRYLCIVIEPYFYWTMSLERKDNDRGEKELPSLDRFLAKNTSEDNASFEQIMDLAKDKEKVKHAWLYEAEAEFKQVGVDLIWIIFKVILNGCLNLSVFLRGGWLWYFF